MNADASNELGELLSAYLDDEVTAEERVHVEQLLASDPKAQALFAKLRETAHAVRALPKGAAPAEVLEALTTRLERETLLGSADPDVTLARHRRPPVRATLAVAAMLAVAIGGGLYVTLKLSEIPRNESTLALKDSGRQRGLSPGDSPGGPTAPRGGSDLPQVSDWEFSARPQSTRQDKSKALVPEEKGLMDLAEPGPAARGTIPPGEDLFAAETRDALTDLGISTVEAKPAPGSAALTAPGAVEQDDALDELAAMPAAELAKEGSGDDVKATRLAGRTVAEFGLDGAIVSTGDGRTFEQRLAAGEPWPALRGHNFGNEPLRLSVRFRAQTGAENFRTRVERLLADRRVPPAVEVAGGVDGALPHARATLVRRAAEAAVPGTARRMYVAGEPGVNFASATSTGRQVLARIPADWLGDLIEETATTDAEGIALQLGGVTANGVEEARSLARELVGPAPTAAPVAPAAPAAEPTGWLALLQRLAERLPVRPEVADGYARGRKAERGGAAERAEGEAVSTLAFADAAAPVDAPVASGGAIVAADLSTQGVAASSTGGPTPVAPPAPAGDELITVVIEMDVEAAPESPDAGTPG